MGRILSDITVELEHSSTSEAPLGAWIECNVSEMIRMAIRLTHGPSIVESVHWVDGTDPYLEWSAPGFAMTLMRRSTGALVVQEHETYD